MDPKGEELAAAIAEIRQRVRARHPNGTVLGNVSLPDLTPLVHARDAAEGKVASIGSVNPRPAGLVNSVAQAMKRLVARALNWHVREQVEFNRAVMGCVQATLEALNDCNRTMAALSARIGSEDTVQQMNDIRMHWSHWRVEWEKRLAGNEITFLRSVSDQQGAFQHRATLMEANFREQMRSQHSNFEAALERASGAIQKRLSADVEDFQKRTWADLRANSSGIRNPHSRGAADHPPAHLSIDNHRTGGSAGSCRISGYRLGEIRREIPRIGSRH